MERLFILWTGSRLRKELGILYNLQRYTPSVLLPITKSCVLRSPHLSMELPVEYVHIQTIPFPFSIRVQEVTEKVGK